MICKWSLSCFDEFVNVWCIYFGDHVVIAAYMSLVHVICQRLH